MSGGSVHGQCIELENRMMESRSFVAVRALMAFICVYTAFGCAQTASKKESERLAATRVVTTAVTKPARNFARWEREIAAYEQADRANPPPKNGILFIGSSTIRLWKCLPGDFPDHKVINRGFGGSQIIDSTHFADRIIFPYQPRMILLRAGGNDIHEGKLPEEVMADFVDFVQAVHRRLPRTEIVYIGLSPAPARWTEVDKGRAMNEMIRREALRMPRVSFIDCDDMTLDAKGQARHELFVDDKLHFNETGYQLLAERVRPFLPTR
jgi:lysophospholipase L1-like esterase